MIFVPNNPMVTQVIGRIGALRFQRYYHRNLARLRWTNSEHVSPSQQAHRAAVGQAAMLYGSARSIVNPAWVAFAASLSYGPYPAWMEANIPACKAGDPTAIAPANPSYGPLATPNWYPDPDSHLCASWAFTGDPGDCLVHVWLRPSTSYAWLHQGSVDAADLAWTSAALDPAVTYEVALAACSTVNGAWAESAHAFETPALIEPEDFDDYVQLDPSSDISTNEQLLTVSTLRANLTAYACRPITPAHTAPGFEHSLTWNYGTATTNGGAAFWALANTRAALSTWSSTSAQAVALWSYYSGSNHLVAMRCFENSTTVSHSDYAASTTYYPLVDRPSETSVRARIYTDLLRQNLKHELVVTVPTGRRWDDLFGVSSRTTGGTAVVSFSTPYSRFVPA